VSGWTRLGGYLGLVALVDSIAILSIVPQQRYTSSSLRDAAGSAAVAGYFLVIVRLGYLAARSNDRGTRRFARVAMLALFVAGAAGGFIGMFVILGTNGSSAA
jgi:hypothetical protein